MQRPPLPYELPIATPPPIQGEGQSKAEPPLPRLKWVWVAFIALFVAIIGMSLLSSSKEPNLNAKSDDLTREKMIEFQVRLMSMVPSDQSSKQKPFEAEVEGLLPKAKTDHHAQKLRIVLRQEDQDKPFGADIDNLLKSKNAEDQAFAKLYSTPPPSKAEATALLKQLDGNELSERLAKVQIQESFGDKKIRSQVFDSSAALGAAIVLTLGGVGFLGGIALWIFYFSQRQSGNLKPKGIPLSNIDWGRADRLIFVALVLITVYLVGSVAVGILFGKRAIDFEFIVSIFIFAAMAICLKVPIFGWRILPEKVGLSTKDLGKNALWALSAFIANIPILAVLMVIAGVISKFFPGGGHPVTEEILSNPKPLQLVSIFYLACVVAPIWEEFFFRGLAFPAFTKALGRPLYGALASSFIFAAIHPQGVVGLVPLIGLAMMLCTVSYQTKSLTANMMLHALHNGAALIAALALAPILS